jgi:hypothetical protein
MAYDPLSEVLERVRRIETRTTIIGRHLGAEVGGGKPEWRDGKVLAPTRNCSIGEMMRVVPHGWDKGVHVYIGDDYGFSFTVIPQ